MIQQVVKIIFVLAILVLLALPFAMGQWIKHEAKSVVEDGYQNIVVQLLKQNDHFLPLEHSSITVNKIHSGWLASTIDSEIRLHGQQYPLAIKLKHGPVWLDGQTPRFGLFSLVIERWPDTLFHYEGVEVDVASVLDVGFHKNGRASTHFDVFSLESKALYINMTLIAKGHMDSLHHFDVDYITIDLPQLYHDNLKIAGLRANASKRHFDSLGKVFYNLSQLHIESLSHQEGENTITLNDINFEPTIDENYDSMAMQWQIDVGNLSYASDGQQLDLGSHHINFVFPELPSVYIKQLIDHDSRQLSLLVDAIDDDTLPSMNAFIRDSLLAIGGKKIKFSYHNDAPYTHAQFQIAFTVPNLHYVLISPNKATKHWCLLEKPNALDRAGMDVISQQPCASAMMSSLEFQSKLAKELLNTFRHHLSVTVNIVYKNQCKQDTNSKSMSLPSSMCSWFGKTLRLAGIKSSMFIEGGNDIQMLDISWHQGKQFINGEVVDAEPEANWDLKPVLP